MDCSGGARLFMKNKIFEQSCKSKHMLPHIDGDFMLDEPPIPTGSMYVCIMFTYIWLMFMVNEGKYASPMDPIGFLGSTLLFYITQQSNLHIL